MRPGEAGETNSASSSVICICSCPFFFVWLPACCAGSTDWPSTLAGETRGDYALHRGALDSADTDAGTAVEVAVDGDDHKLSSLFPAIDMTR